MNESPMVTETPRRRFLQGAALAATGAAALGFPMVAKAQGPISMRWQSTWPPEGHLPRVRARFREEGQRHDRRRPQDRGAAGGRGRAGLRPARRACRRARSTAATACSSTTTASRPRSRSGARARPTAWTPTCCCPGTSTAAASSSSTKLYASIGANVVSFPYGPMATQPLGWYKKPITKAEDFKGLKFRTVGISIDVFTGHGRGGQRAARRRDRPGHGPRACSTRPSSTTRRPTASSASPTSPRSACCRATTRTPSSSRSRSTRRKFDALPGQDEGDHRERGRGGVGRHVVEGHRPLLEGLHRAADQGQGPVLQDAGLAVLQKQLEIYDAVADKKATDNPAVQGDQRVRRRSSPSAR